MDESQIRSLVAQVLRGIAPEADLASVGDQDDLREALDLDSMDFLNLVIGLSEGTGRAIPEAAAPRLRTLAGIIGYLSSSAAAAS